MNARHDLERRLADLYRAEAPRQAPDRVLHAALATIDTTRQRRVLIRVPRRFQIMSTSARSAIAAAAVVVVGALVLAVVGPFRLAGTGPGAVATPSPSPSTSSSALQSPSPSLIAAPSPSPLGPLTGSFTSAVFGVSSSYPAGWKIHPAAVLWTTGIPWNCEGTCPFDQIYEKESETPMYHLASQPLAGKAPADWVTEVLADPGWDAKCPIVTEAIKIDGNDATLASICGESLFVAATTSGGRGYVILLYRVYDINQFKSILATVRLHPADALTVRPSAAPS